MNTLSARTGGGILLTVGLLLSALHLFDAATLYGDPTLLLIDVLIPLALSVVVVVAGVAMARGRLVPDRFADRAIAWSVLGALSLTGVVVWMFAYALIEGLPSPNFRTAMLNAATFGALVGLLVGVYDARSRKKQADVDRLNRINGTLRITTQEMVQYAGRTALEQAVCDRLASSDPYEAVWIGRYGEEASQVRPAAWAGMPDEYFESIVVTVDDTPTGNGAGGRAIKTREIQCVPDVFADPTMEPWWDLFREQGAESLAVVPVVHDEAVYGFYSIYADRPEVFDPTEREVLTELGETLGHAVYSIQVHERLARREHELSRQNERLEEFASVVSHDLRNPLNVAQGFLDLERDERNSERLDRVDRALTRMDELIDDLLTLARQGQSVSEPAPVSLQSIVDDAWATVDAPAASLRVDGELGAVSCDVSRVRQLLENLFRNAVEHGDADVTVSVGRTDEGFYVEDDGPGIPTDERAQVFDAGYSTNPIGTGFGLNIVRSIAEAHGWNVTLAEAGDGGARFEFAGVASPDVEAAA